jgi:hypothetical protein
MRSASTSAEGVFLWYGFGVPTNGNIDRVTGRVDATTVLSDPTKQPDPNTATIHYDLICTATDRAQF